ncbi:hypothetical protein bsdE14_19280 [Clostridium omnivorum]|uniref:Uncharacterized protein n=1 Tax=Clostridium omnivorum TaxID=1604902 RepID=A0ABQ5N5L0_9CLOT|nr:hypothetical protein bsdE14_19280 [Clostridium sp. E14]
MVMSGYPNIKAPRIVNTAFKSMNSIENKSNIINFEKMNNALFTGTIIICFKVQFSLSSKKIIEAIMPNTMGSSTHSVKVN